MERINLVYIHSHDVGRYISPFGYKMDTPCLQQLAESGMLFRNMHCAAPSCSPSRAAMLTGMYAHCSGMYGLVNRGFELEKKECHLAPWLSCNGYKTILAGTQHVVKDRDGIPYDIILEEKKGEKVLNSQRLVCQGMEALDSLNGESFFLDIGFGDTHRPYRDGTAQYNPAYIYPPEPLPDTRQVREDMAGFMAEAKIFDNAVGSIINGLDSRGLLQNTLILCTTDHGIAFPAMKCNLNKFGTGVFCIMSLPGKIMKGSASDALLSQIDLFPAICELLELPQPPWLQGTSFIPLLKGNNEQIRDELFAEITYHCNYEPQRMVRTPNYLYIRRYTSRNKVYCADCDEGLSKQMWMENGWQDRSVDKEQLYDLMFDPQEAKNQVNNPEYESVLVDMRERLDCWQHETSDFLYTGKECKFITNTPEGNIYVSKDTDCNTSDLWLIQEQPKGYA